MGGRGGGRELGREQRLGLESERGGGKLRDGSEYTYIVVRVLRVTGVVRVTGDVRVTCVVRVTGVVRVPRVVMVKG